MFEEVAEEYTKKLPFVYETELVRKIVRMFCKSTFEDAAEFGYNKGRSEVKEIIKDLLSLKSTASSAEDINKRFSVRERAEQFLKEATE